MNDTGDVDAQDADAGEAIAAADTTGSAADTDKPRRLSTTLIVIAALIAVISTLTTWVRAELLDTDEWVEVSSGLLAEPEIQEALTTYLSEQLFERVDLASELEAVLPEPVSRLAGPLAGALRDPVTNAIARVIESDRFAELWENANRAAHERMVAILRDETRPGISTADGTVTLDLRTIITNVGERVGIPTSALERIPEGTGQVVIFESDELSSMQTIVQILDVLAWFLFLLVVAIYAVAVAVARPAWRTALRNVGVSLAIAGATLLILRALGVRAAVGAVVNDPDNEPLGQVVGLAATRLVGEAAWTGIVYGVLIAVFAIVLGSHRWAVACRRQIGRATESIGVAIGAAVFGILLLLWWSPGRSFDRLVTALVFVVLSVAGVVTLLAVSRREYRNASPG